jgi:hypothetical protein
VFDMGTVTRSKLLTRLAVLIGLAAGLASFLVPVSSAAADEPVPTTTTLTIKGGRTYGDTMTLTATIRAAGKPSGTVQFGIRPSSSADPVPMGEPVAVAASGRATYTFRPGTGPVTYTATFVGAGNFAGSAAEQFFVTGASGVRLAGRGTIVAGLRSTLTPSAYARHLGSGRPAEGVRLTFTAGGRMPNLFDYGGGEVICAAVTDAKGFASCGAAGVRPASFWRANKAYVASARDGYYGFSAAMLPRYSLR